jgi:hypothetical protein
MFFNSPRFPRHQPPGRFLYLFLATGQRDHIRGRRREALKAQNYLIRRPARV